MYIGMNYLPCLPEIIEYEFNMQRQILYAIETRGAKMEL